MYGNINEIRKCFWSQEKRLAERAKKVMFPYTVGHFVQFHSCTCTYHFIKYRVRYRSWHKIDHIYVMLYWFIGTTSLCLKKTFFNSMKKKFPHTFFNRSKLNFNPSSLSSTTFHFPLSSIDELFQS